MMQITTKTTERYVYLNALNPSDLFRLGNAVYMKGTKATIVNLKTGEVETAYGDRLLVICVRQVGVWEVEDV